MNNSRILIVDMQAEGVNGAVGRVLGIQVKDKVINAFNNNNYEKIVLDFTDIPFITSGFAKELLGGLYAAYTSSFKDIVTVRINKDNLPLKNTIIRALAAVVDNKQV